MCVAAPVNASSAPLGPDLIQAVVALWRTGTGSCPGMSRSSTDLVLNVQIRAWTHSGFCGLRDQHDEKTCS